MVPFCSEACVSEHETFKKKKKHILMAKRLSLLEINSTSSVIFKKKQHELAKDTIFQK